MSLALAAMLETQEPTLLMTLDRKDQTLPGSWVKKFTTLLRNLRPASRALLAMLTIHSPTLSSTLVRMFHSRLGSAPRTLWMAFRIDGRFWKSAATIFGMALIISQRSCTAASSSTGAISASFVTMVVTMTGTCGISASIMRGMA